jgi:general stress protein 26
MAAGDREHLEAMMKDFRTAMLGTFGSDGKIHSRPLTVADVVEGDDVLYFPTGISSGVVAEVKARPDVNVTMQADRKFVSLSATTIVSQDRALIERLWSDAWKVWFPGGKDDPNIAILVVTPHSAEYWDESGAKGLNYLFKAASAVVSGTTPKHSGPEEHGKVALG